MAWNRRSAAGMDRSVALGHRQSGRVAMVLAIILVLAVLAAGGAWFALTYFASGPPESEVATDSPESAESDVASGSPESEVTSGTPESDVGFQMPAWDEVRQGAEPEGGQPAPEARTEGTEGTRAASPPGVDPRVLEIAENLNKPFARNAGQETAFTDAYPRRALQMWINDRAGIPGDMRDHFMDSLVVASRGIGEDPRINRISSVPERVKSIQEALFAYRDEYVRRAEAYSERIAAAEPPPPPATATEPREEAASAEADSRERPSAVERGRGERGEEEAERAQAVAALRELLRAIERGEEAAPPQVEADLREFIGAVERGEVATPQIEAALSELFRAAYERQAEAARAEAASRERPPVVEREEETAQTKTDFRELLRSIEGVEEETAQGETDFRDLLRAIEQGEEAVQADAKPPRPVKPGPSLIHFLILGIGVVAFVIMVLLLLKGGEGKSAPPRVDSQE